MQSLLLGRGSRIALPFVGLVALLALATSLLATWLVGRTVREWIREQLRDTVRLVTRGHFPLSHETATHLRDYIHAEIVVAAGRRVYATSLDPARARAFERALDEGGFPVGREVTIREGELAGTGLLVASAPLEDGRALHLLYPLDLEAAERGRATRPVLVLSVVGIALAVALGAVKERSVVRERTEALGRLVSALAHEVKNPLGAIGLTVETLRDALPGPREREAVDVVASEVERLSLLVDELRLLGGGERTLVLRPVSLGEVVDGVLALLRRTIEHRGLRLEAPAAAGHVVRADARALKQALLNLLLNAIDASPRGGTVRLEVEPGAGSVRLAVSDEGAGVPAASRSRLFEPFVTTKEGGTGLGLALARRVAEAHGGTLRLVPSGGGARFVLEIPTEAAT